MYPNVNHNIDIHRTKTPTLCINKSVNVNCTMYVMFKEMLSQDK